MPGLHVCTDFGHGTLRAFGRTHLEAKKWTLCEAPRLYIPNTHIWLQSFLHLEDSQDKRQDQNKTLLSGSQTDRQKDKQTTSKQTHKQTGKQAHKQTGTSTHTQDQSKYKYVLPTALHQEQMKDHLGPQAPKCLFLQGSVLEPHHYGRDRFKPKEKVNMS